MATEKVKTTLEIAVESKQLSSFQSLLKRVFDVEPIARYRREQEKITAELIKQQRASTGHGAPAGGGGGGGTGGAGAGTHRRPPGLSHGGGHGGGAHGGPGWGKLGLAAGVGFVAGHTVGKAPEAAEHITKGEGATMALLRSIPLVGAALSGALEAAEGFADKAIAANQASAGAYGQTGMGSVGEMGMTRFGVSRQELPGMLSSLAQTSGLRGKSLAGIAPEALKLEKLTGISGGAMLGAAGTGISGELGKTESKRLTMETVSTGIEAGIRKARLGTFVQQMASNLEGMRSRGIMVAPGSLTTIVDLVAGTGRKGLQAEAGVHAGTTIQSAVQGAGDRNDFFGALSLQTAMKNGGPGGKKLSPFEAQLALEENPETFAPLILQRIGKMGGSAAAKAMMLRQAMPQLSVRQAYSLAQGTEHGEFGAGKAPIGTEAGEAYLKDQEKGFGGGLAAKQAAMANSQIETGEKTAPDILAMREHEEEMAKMAAPFAAKAGAYTSEKIEHVVTSKDPVHAMIHEGGAMLREAMEAVAPTVEGAKKKVVGAAEDYLGKGEGGLGVDQAHLAKFSDAMKVVTAGLLKLGELLGKIPGMHWAAEHLMD